MYSPYVPVVISRLKAMISLYMSSGRRPSDEDIRGSPVIIRYWLGKVTGVAFDMGQCKAERNFEALVMMQWLKFNL